VTAESLTWLPRRLREPWLLNAVAWAAAAGGLAVLIHGSLTAEARLVDLHVYRTAGVSVLTGRPVYATLTDSVLPFTYPPAAAVLAVPLAWMSWGTAQLAWVPVVYLSLAAIIWYAFRPLLARAGELAPGAFGVIFLVCAYLMPMRQQIHYGQVDIVLVAMCTVDCAARKPRWPRGALIGLAAAVKLIPGIFIAYLLVTGRRRAAGVAVLSMAAWTAAAYLVIPGDSRFYWTRAIFDSNRLGRNAQTANQSLRGGLLRLFQPAAVPAGLWVALAAIAAIACLAAARSAWRGGNEIAGVAITGLLAVLVSPVSWIHHLVWVVLALGVIIGDGRDRRRVLTAAVAAAFYTSIIPYWGEELLRVSAMPIAVARVIQDSFVIGAVVLIVIITRLLRAGADHAAPLAPLAQDDLLAGHGQS
jgi:alpha-1,2-mannosyltransferase